MFKFYFSSLLLARFIYRIFAYVFFIFIYIFVFGINRYVYGATSKSCVAVKFSLIKPLKLDFYTLILHEIYPVFARDSSCFVVCYTKLQPQRFYALFDGVLY